MIEITEEEADSPQAETTLTEQTDIEINDQDGHKEEDTASTANTPAEQPDFAMRDQDGHKPAEAPSVTGDYVEAVISRNLAKMGPYLEGLLEKHKSKITLVTRNRRADLEKILKSVRMDNNTTADATPTATPTPTSEPKALPATSSGASNDDDPPLRDLRSEINTPGLLDPPRQVIRIKIPPHPAQAVPPPRPAPDGSHRRPRNMHVKPKCLRCTASKRRCDGLLLCGSCKTDNAICIYTPAARQMLDEWKRLKARWIVALKDANANPLMGALLLIEAEEKFLFKGRDVYMRWINQAAEQSNATILETGAVAIPKSELDEID